MPRCAICKSAHFALVAELEAHIAGDHFQCTPYECEKCRFAKFPTEYAIREHYEKDHNMTDYHVRYHISPDTLTKQREVRKAMLLMSPSGPCYKDSTAPRVLSTAPHVLSTDAAKESHLSAEGSITAIEIATTNLVENILELVNRDDAAMATESATAISPGVISDSVRDTSGAETSSEFIARIQGTVTKEILYDQQHQKEKMKVNCRECKTSVAKRSNSYLHHTNVHHLNLPLFRCLACNKGFPGLKIDIHKHVERFHNGDVSLIEDNQVKFKPQIRDACTKYFAYLPMKKYK